MPIALYKLQNSIFKFLHSRYERETCYGVVYLGCRLRLVAGLQAMVCVLGVILLSHCGEYASECAYEWKYLTIATFAVTS